MLLNNAVSVSVGLIPFVGDIVLAVYKANSRNAALLEEFLRIRGDEFLKAERERTQDATVVKPGAGREPGEAVTGPSGTSGATAVEKKGSTGSNWFRRRSTKSTKSQGKEKAMSGDSSPRPGMPHASGERGSRFIENVEPASPTNAAGDLSQTKKA